MSDISIPGVKSKYDTQKLIDDLMKVERIPKTRAEERLKDIELQRTTWLDLNRRMTSLRESARALFSFQNPFNERVATSSDEAVLTATATRDAAEESITLTVEKIATADRFQSIPLDTGTKVPKGTYEFTVADKTVKLEYSGGNLEDFVKAINRKGGDTVSARLVAVTRERSVLVMESRKTGSANRLGFGKDAEKFALEAGLVEKVQSSRQDLPAKNVQSFMKPLDPQLVVVSGDTLSVGPGAEAALRLASAVPTKGLVVEMTVELTDEEAQPAQKGPPPGPSIPATGVIEYEGIRIQSAMSEAPLPEYTAPPLPPKSDDFSPVYIIDGQGRQTPAAKLEAGAGPVQVRLDLADFGASFAAVGIRNGNTGRTVKVSDVRILDPRETGGFRPKNPVDTAGDALLEYDGIRITRPENTIDDLVPGLTFNLWDSSEKPVKLTVEPDREAAKEALIELVGNYNRLMAELNILSRTDESILSEITYLTDDEKKTYRERLGLMQGDSTISQLRTTLQQSMANAYPTARGSALLASFGISTDTRRGGSYDATRLRGYIEIDEAALDKALKEKFMEMKEVLGSDTDGDLIVDSGAAYRLDVLTKAYVETGGIVTIRTQTLDSQISRQKTEIASLETQLARKEDDLKRKYGMMESSLGQMESSSAAWDSFSKQND